MSHYLLISSCALASCQVTVCQAAMGNLEAVGLDSPTLRGHGHGHGHVGVLASSPPLGRLVRSIYGKTSHPHIGGG